ncbi:MAG: LysR substrate-binding domain-containing protein, partial [Pseudomonadota bacterium]
MRPTLRQLQYLVAVADTGRFGEAAKFLNVSQPSLSAQIAEAEAQLGVVLVERGRTGALMTPVGEDIVRRARIVLRQVEDLKTAARQGDAGLAGRLRLGVLPSIGPYLLPRAVKRLHGQYPDLRLSVRDERTIDLETKLHDGRLDAVISTPEDHVEDETLNLFSERLWICAAPDDPLAKDKSAVPLDGLEGRILMSLGYGHRLNLMVQALADAAGAHVSGEYEGTSLDALRQMAAMGVGLAILPSLYALSEAKRADDIVVRPIDHPLAARDISLIWRATSPLAASFETLGGVLKDVANHL